MRRFGRTSGGVPWKLLLWLGVATAVVGVLVVGKLALDVRNLAAAHRERCARNLQQLAALIGAQGSGETALSGSGQAFLLAWRKSQFPIRAGEEGVLCCPGDASTRSPESWEQIARYDAVDLANADEDLCSYAARDFDRFPLRPDLPAEEPVVACVGRFHGGAWQPSHRDTLHVGYADGTVRTYSPEQLGFADGSPVIGPDSPSPVLRVLCFRPGRTEGAGR